jgi:RNA recognition motif-containing protein
MRFFSTPIISELIQQEQKQTTTEQPPVTMASDEKDQSRKKSAAWKRHRTLSRRKAAKLNERQRKQVLQPAVPKIESEDFNVLFQRAALKQNFPKIEEVLQKIMRCVEKSNTQSRKKGHLRETPLSSILLEMLHQTHPQKTFQIQILERILAAKRRTSKRAQDAIKKLLPTTQEKEQLKNTLIATREYVIENQIQWNSSMANKESTSEMFQQIKNTKMVHSEEHGKVAMRLVKHLYKSLPLKNVRAFASMLKTYANDTSSSETKKKSSKKRLPSIYLSDPIENCVGEAHYHLISKQVKNFLFFNLCTAIHDSKIKNSQSIWDKMKKKFVQSMMELQRELHDKDKDDVARKTNHSGIHVNAESYIDADAFPRTVGESESRKSPKLLKSMVHLVFDALPLLKFRSMEPNSTLSQPVNGTYTNGLYLNGSLVNSDHGSVNGEKTLQSAALNKMVFIDNLPVDITEPELRALYLRLGTIKQVEIFNLRPDLNPGELTKAEEMKRWKRQIKSVRSSTERWQRPKTPVYALIEFADGEGQRKALDDSLRVFGMVIRRHPARSIRTSDMMSLFIEGIPYGHPCVDLEHQLSQTLSPDFFVSLHAGQKNTAIAGSCEIKFPSFESAYQSYIKLKKLDIVSSERDCRINWVRTRSDAMDWFTKKLGF